MSEEELQFLIKKNASNEKGKKKLIEKLILSYNLFDKESYIMSYCYLFIIFYIYISININFININFP